MKELNYIRVVLVEPTHPGNIGAVARVMGNMGVGQLMLVNPMDFPSPVASARASGADYILEAATICENLDQALADCTRIFGATARRRSIEWPSLAPWEAMQTACHDALSGARVAIVFGRESSGLRNQELDRCHHLVRIPVDDEFSSLNLGAAVAVMLYELRKSTLMIDRRSDRNASGRNGKAPSKKAVESIATAEEMQGFYVHMEQVLHQIEFIDGRSSKLMRKIIRLFNRAHPSREEINLLRGILSSIEYQKYR